MDIRKLILATIATEAGCSAYCPDLGRGPFSLSEELSGEDAAELQNDYGEEFTCEEACYHAYYEKNLGTPGFHIVEVTDCSSEIAPGDTGEPPETVSVQCEGIEEEVPCKGRRPLGHVEVPGSARTLGERFAHIAHLEAASVVAFLQLVRQLTELGAPADLIARCRQAAAEEVVHARMFGDLARRSGASIPKVHQAPAAEDVLSIALHNATEGCVGETWAALQARWQAHHSPDPQLRRVFLRVAADETGHAQLAWDLHAWLLSRLDPAQRELVLAAQRRALADLPALARAQSFASPPILGLPSPALASSLAERFAAGLAA